MMLDHHGCVGVWRGLVWCTHQRALHLYMDRSEMSLVIKNLCGWMDVNYCECKHLHKKLLKFTRDSTTTTHFVILQCTSEGRESEVVAFALFSTQYTPTCKQILKNYSTPRCYTHTRPWKLWIKLEQIASVILRPRWQAALNTWPFVFSDFLTFQNNRNNK